MTFLIDLFILNFEFSLHSKLLLVFAGCGSVHYPVMPLRRNLCPLPLAQKFP